MAKAKAKAKAVPPALAEIETLTRGYAAERDTLGALVRQLQEARAEQDARFMPAIREAVDAATNARETLRVAIEGRPDLFARPKTLVIEGIRIGLEKARGKIDIPDEAGTIKLIRRHLPDQEELLIKVTEKPKKTALGALPVAMLKKLGVHVAEAGDAVVIKPTQDEIEKLVKKLLASDDPSEAATDGDDCSEE